jgi:hypothetical protein
MAWARRLRSFASRRGPRRPLGQRVSAAKLYTLVTAVVVVLGIVTFATVHGLGVGSPAGEPSARTRAAVDYGPPPGPPPPGPPPPTAGYLPLTAKFSQKPVQTRFAMITSPQNGVPVRLCATITGTSKLPAGQTLLLSVENLNAGDGVRHLRTVDGWQRPATLNRWRGVLFIGLPEDPVGWHYLVEVFVVPLATLSKEITDAASLGRHWDMTLPASSVVGASVIVSRAMTPDRLC